MPDCTACGNHLTTDYVRVFGDNDGTIDGCPHCPPPAARGPGQTAPDASDAGGRDETAESGGTGSPDQAVEGSETAVGSSPVVAGRSLEPPAESTAPGSSRAVPSPARPDASGGAARRRPPRARIHAALASVVQTLR